MKKNIFTLFLFVGLAASAQDTLGRPPVYCAVHYWPGDTLPLNEFDFSCREAMFLSDLSYRCVQLVVATTLSKDFYIYGLSIGIYGLPDISKNYAIDTTPRAGTIEYFVRDTGTVGLCEMVRIFNRRADSLYVARETEWCYGENPVSYYMHPRDYELTTSTTYREIFRGASDSFVPEYIPVYDIYFDSPYPYTAGDTLYMGISGKTSIRRWGESKFERIPMWVAGYGAQVGQASELYQIYARFLDSSEYNNCDAGPYPFSPPIHQGDNSIMFPIITPAQNAVDRPDNPLVSVSLTPNPAHNETKIETLSELLNIEILSVAGHLVYSRRHSGHAATIDTRGWPSGVYIVNAVTSMGTGVKKLVIK